MLDGVEHRIKPGFAVLVPAGTRHNIINAPSGPMKLYTLYAPPNHRDGVVHATKVDAESDKEHFDGKTTDRHRPDKRPDDTWALIWVETSRIGRCFAYLPHLGTSS